MTPASDNVSHNAVRIGLIEVPDHAIHVLNHFLRSPRYQVTVVINHDPRSRIARVARKWKLRVQPLPNRPILQACDRIIVGDEDPHLLAAIRSFVADRDTQVQSLRMVIKELVERPSRSFVHHDSGSGRSGSLGAIRETSNCRGAFDPYAILGLGESEAPQGITIDSKDPRIKNHLDRIVREVGALTGSIMLMDAGSACLRFACTSGMGGSEITAGLVRPGEGVAGRAFQQGRALFRQQAVPQWAESGDVETNRLACSIPLVLGTRRLGVLSVNLESERIIAPERLVERLEEEATETVRLLLLAVRAELGDDGSGLGVLRHLVGQLLYVEDNILFRMDAVGEVLARSIRAEQYQIYLADRQANRFQRLSRDPDHGMCLERAAQVRGSLLGWILERGRPQGAEFTDASGDRTSVVYLPICSLKLPAMVVIENAKLPSERLHDRLADLGDLTRIIEDLILVEEGISDRDFVTEVDMRIADETGDLARLSREERTVRITRLAVKLLAADAAVWVNLRDGRTVSTVADGRESEFVGALALAHAERLAGRAGDEGLVRGGPDSTEWSSDSGPCPLRYAGARSKDGSGVLLVFFSPYENLGTFMQVAPETLFQVIERMCDRVPDGGGGFGNVHGGPDSESPGSGAGESDIDPDADILVIRSGGVRVGILWQFVERVGSANTSRSPIGVGRTISP